MRVVDQQTGKAHNLIFDDEVFAALKEADSRFACAHAHAEVRETRASNGSAHYRPQCLTCGARAGNAVKKPDGEITTEDLQLRADWDRRREVARQEALQRMLGRQLTHRSEFWARYKIYMSSPEWAGRRELVLGRANGICEGCGTARATQVHHRTYDHLEHEFLFELVAICRECHERLHADDEADQTNNAADEIIDF